MNGYYIKGVVMEKRKLELAILLLILVLFSGGMSFLHGRVEDNISQENFVEDAIEAKQLSPSKKAIDSIKKRLTLTYKVQKERRSGLRQKILTHLEPLAASESIKKMATYLQPYAPTMIISVLTAIKNQEGPRLSKELQQALILKIAINNTAMRPQLYRFLVENYTNEPVFFIALMHNYADAINHIKIIFGKDSSEYTQFMNNTVDAIIARNDYKLLKKLAKFDFSSQIDRGNELLKQVVTENKNVGFVPILIQKLNTNPDYSEDGKKTVLMLAVEQQNKPMVKALVAGGSNPNLLLDNAVGSAYDIAFKKGFVVIEGLLSK